MSGPFAAENPYMCGRYGFAPGEFREIKLRFNIGGDIPLFKSRYNIANWPPLDSIKYGSLGNLSPQ